MANTVQASDPVDSLITEKAETAYEFPTSASRPSSNENGESSTSGNDMRSVVKERLSDVRDGMATRYRAASETTDDFVHDNPWKAIALAAVGGLLIGMLASR